MRGLDSSTSEPLHEPLTRREREVLGLLGQGYSAPEIAHALTLALSTIRWHLEQIYAKLGVNSKRQAVNRARALGLVAAAPGPIAPAPPTAAPPKHNLPLPLTRFFGREAEIAQIRQRLATDSLITCIGPGGVGKTRLALHVARACLAEFAEGVWLAELAPLSDPGLVAQAVATALGMADERGRPIIESLIAFLRERQVLLVLDNCEHLLEACARLAEALLRACPRLRILTTSREGLAIAGETLYPVPSLSFPDPAHLPELSRLGSYESLTLFADRAQALLPGYQIGTHNAVALARICARLDGIPLAIEMAAARINTLSAEQLADRLDDAFRLLTRGSRTALPRQQTLRGTLDWSYALLHEKERWLLQRLSVFVGGCTLEAAEAVGSGDGLEPGEVLEVLSALVAKSMVIAERQAGEGARYNLLEMVRQFGWEKLETTARRQSLSQRHRDYFLDFALTNCPKLDTSDRLIWTSRIAAERENLRQALEWSLNNLTEVEAGPKLMLRLFRDDMVGTLWHYEEAVHWYRQGLALCESRGDIAPRLHAGLLEAAATLFSLNDPHAALSLGKRSVEIGRSLGPAGRAQLMSSLSSLGWRYMVDLDEVAQAVAPYTEAETILEEIGPTEFTPHEYGAMKAWLAYVKSMLAEKHGQYQAAQSLATESIRLSEAIGDRWSSIEPHTLLGLVHLHQGEFELARAHFQEGLRLNMESRRRFESHLLLNLGVVDLMEGKLEEARSFFCASLRRAIEMPDYNIVASGLGRMAAVLAQQGQPYAAARLSGAAQAVYARQRRNPWEDSTLDTLLPGWQARPEQAALREAFAAGQAMSNAQAVAYVLDAAR